MSAAFTVVVTDHPWPSVEAEEKILARVGAEMTFANSTSEAELEALAGDADAILTCFRDVGPTVVRAGTKLKVIGRYGIGVDNIAVDIATEHGILVTNVPFYCQDEVSDHALTNDLGLRTRQLVVFDADARRGVVA